MPIEVIIKRRRFSFRKESFEVHNGGNLKLPHSEDGEMGHYMFHCFVGRKIGGIAYKFAASDENRQHGGFLSSTMDSDRVIKGLIASTHPFRAKIQREPDGPSEHLYARFSEDTGG